MRHFAHHIGDYAAATAHLSFVEDAAYHRLLRRYYQDEKPLPCALVAVQRIVGARSKDERAAVQAVLEEFFTLSSDGWHQTRADEEIAAYHERAAAARQNGNRGGRPKITKAVSGNNPAETKPVPAEKLTNNQEPITSNQSEEEGARAPRTPKPEKADGKFKLPADWRPDAACRAYAQDRGLNPDDTADVFVDHFTVRKGKSERRDAAGWAKRWEAWCRTDAGGTGAVGARPTRATQPSRGNEAYFDALAAASDRSLGNEPDRR